MRKRSIQQDEQVVSLLEVVKDAIPVEKFEDIITDCLQMWKQHKEILPCQDPNPEADDESEESESDEEENAEPTNTYDELMKNLMTKKRHLKYFG